MTEDIFAYPTYIVLNVPSPVAESVKRIRRRYDPERAELAVEISLTGSCGIGSIAPGQDPARVFTLIDLTASRTAPFFTRFEQVKCFHHTGIFYFTLNEPERFMDLHRHLAACGIRYLPNPWPYEPHCTLTLRHSMPKHLAARLLDLTPPRTPFQINTVSVYQLPDAKGPRLLHRCNFGG